MKKIIKLVCLSFLFGIAMIGCEPGQMEYIINEVGDTTQVKYKNRAEIFESINLQIDKQQSSSDNYTNIRMLQADTPSGS